MNQLPGFGTILISNNDSPVKYSGYSRAFFKTPTQYGIFTFAWGAEYVYPNRFDAIKSIGDLIEFMQDLYNDIEWFDSLADAQKFADARDTSNEPWFDSRQGRKFLAAIIDYKES